MRRFAFAALFVASTAFAGDSAEQYLNDIYAPYLKAPGAQADNGRYFCPSLNALIARDNDLANAQQEVPFVDGDLICDCQDGALADLKIRMEGEHKAHVSFTIDKQARDLHMALQWLDGSWCIDNITGADGDLRKSLQDDIDARSQG